MTTLTMPWGQVWEIGNSTLGYTLMVLLAIALVLLSIDGMRLVFRGTRDYINVTMGKSLLIGRICGTVAAVCLFFSGWAPILTIVSWLGGVKPLGKWPNLAPSK